MNTYIDNLVFEKRTYYPPNTDTNFIDELDYVTTWTTDNTPKLFWKRDFKRNPFKKRKFFYAELNHPTEGTAIYGASRNKGFVWQFDTEKDLKSSLNYTLGSIYKDMLKDGYIKIKQGEIDIRQI